jgi:hypothetical protein
MIGVHICDNMRLLSSVAIAGRIPSDATHFCWAHPSPEFDDQALMRQHTSKVDVQSSEFLFLTAGGFIYTKHEQQKAPVVVGINAVGFQDKDVEGVWEIKVTLKDVDCEAGSALDLSGFVRKSDCLSCGRK